MEVEEEEEGVAAYEAEVGRMGRDRDERNNRGELSRNMAGRWR